MMKHITYPWRQFFRQPILVLLVAWNYRQRRLKKLPDVWYWADKKLFASMARNQRRLMNWQPIETAPKTGRILVWNAYFGVYSSEYTEKREGEEGKPFSECKLVWSGYPLGLAGGILGKWYCHASFWMPLPEPPVVGVSID